jgi:hypothetical protein
LEIDLISFGGFYVPPLPLRRGEDSGEGFSPRQRNPHPTLSLSKEEAILNYALENLLEFD